MYLARKDVKNNLEVFLLHEAETIFIIFLMLHQKKELEYTDGILILSADNGFDVMGCTYIWHIAVD